MPVWLTRLRLRARATLSRTSQQELRDELQLHLQMLVDEYVAQGLPRAEAEWRAHREFGNVTRLQETSHDLFSFGVLTQVGRDISFAVRMMRRAPAFTAVAVISLAIGIGGTTAAYCLLDRVYLRRLPVEDPEALVTVHVARPDLRLFTAAPPEIAVGQTGLSVREFHALSRASVFADTFLWGGVATYQVRGREPAPDVVVERATSGYFSTLRPAFALGRPFGEPDAVAGAAPTAVISHRFWQSHFNGDPEVIGDGVTLSRREELITATVIGVVDPGFAGIEAGSSVDIWLPLAARDASWTPRQLDWWIGRPVMGRLRRDLDRGAAASELRPLYRDALQASAAEFSATLSEAQRDALLGQELVVQRGATGFAGRRPELRTPVIVLTASAIALLLIACANVAALLLARGASRRAELAMRVALGGDRLRLVRQLLFESLTLGLTGGALGLLIAYLAVGLLRQAPQIGAEMPLAIDARAVSVAVTISLISVMVFGLLPAVKVTDVNIGMMFKGLRPTGGFSRWCLQDALIAAQIALSIVLLVVAGLLGRTYWNLRNVDTGFDPDTFLIASNDRVAVRTALERLAGLPGIEVAGAWQGGLLRPGMQIVFPIHVDGDAREIGGNDRTSLAASITSDFFTAAGISLLSGRAFRAEDTQRNVAIVTSTWARHFVGDGDAVGKTFRANSNPTGTRYEIIGVVEDITYRSLREERPRVLFRPLAADARLSEFVVRTKLPPSALAAEIGTALSTIAPTLRLTRVQSMEEIASATVARDRTLAGFAMFLSVVATALAAIGLYGSMTYAISRRTNEIGLRIALGAAPFDVVAMVMRSAVWVTAVGIAAGLSASVVASRYLGSILFGVSVTDTATAAAAVAVLVVAIAAAAYVPVRRASEVDPMVSLRCE